MNALNLRDQSFLQLHNGSLKSRGFIKRGHWSVREVNGLVQSFYLRASRFGSNSEAVFWVDVKIFNEAWHNLLFSPLPYAGPAEGKPNLLTEGLNTFCVPRSDTFKLNAQSDILALGKQLATAAETGALPLLDSCSTLTKLVEYWHSKPASTQRYITCAGLYRLLAQDAAARAAIDSAKALATHENELRWLEVREQSIFNDAT